jgi:phage tail-like protein
MDTGHVADHYGSFRYLVAIDGVPRAAFGYCAGLQGDHPVEFFIGDDGIDLHEVADASYEPHVVLAQGFAFDDTLHSWEDRCAHGRGERHDGEIVQIDTFGRERGRWHIRGAWPVTLQEAGAVGGARPFIDTLEIAYERISRG